MAFKTAEILAREEQQTRDGVVRVGFHDRAYIEKPSKVEVQNVIKKYIEPQSDTIEKLAHYVVIPLWGDKAIVGAHTWSPGVLRGGAKQENWIEQQLFAVDIDNEDKQTDALYSKDDPRFLSLDAALERCERFGILPVFAYTTFSAPEREKYRIVWCLPEKTQDSRIRQAIQLALMEVFREADISCKNADRIYFGGRELVYENYQARLDISKLFEAVYFSVAERDSTNVPRNMKRFAQECGLNTTNGLPSIYTKNDASTASLLKNILIDLRSQRQNLQSPGYCGDYILDFTAPLGYDRRGNHAYDLISDERHELETERNVDWDALYKRCPVFRDFMDGVDKHNDTTFAILTNLLYIEGGIDKFWEGLRNRRTYNERKWTDNIIYLRKRVYGPILYTSHQISEYYPDVEKVARAPNILSAAKLRRGDINVYQKMELKTIEQAQQEFDEAFNTAISHNEPRTTLLKFPTGLGKSEAYLRRKDVLIAVPTHKLKNELVERMKAAGNHDVIATPDIPEGLEPTLLDHIDRLYKKGAARTVGKLLHDLVEKNPLIAEYIKQLDEATKARDKAVITTHERLMYLRTHHNTIIIDEDPTATLLVQSSAKITELETTLYKARHKGLGYVPRNEDATLKGMLDMLIAAPEGMVHGMPNFLHMKEATRKLETAAVNGEYSSNVINFINCKYFTKIKEHVYYIRQRRLPVNKNVIILSATASNFIYRRLFPDIEIVDCGLVETVGKVTQFTQYAGSRRMLQEIDKDTGQLIRAEDIEEIKELSKDFKVITHKTSAALFDDVVATFGGLVGLDAFGGEDIAVIGTPHLAPVAYILLATALGIKASNEDTTDYVRVHRNGVEFRFETYTDHPELQTLQLDLIEGELVQAVGRARVLRNKCEVLVFSNYPVPGAEYR